MVLVIAIVIVTLVIILTIYKSVKIPKGNQTNTTYSRKETTEQEKTTYNVEDLNQKPLTYEEKSRRAYEYIKDIISKYAGDNIIKELLNMLPHNEYFVLHEAKFPHFDKECQINSLIISRYGVFLIQNINEKGKLIGNKDDKLWRVIEDGKERTLYNPLKRIESYAKNLKYLLGNAPIFTFVVSNLKNGVDLSDVKDFVYPPEQLLFRIKNKRDILIQPKQLNVIYDVIMEKRVKSA